MQTLLDYKSRSGRPPHTSKVSVVSETGRVLPIIFSAPMVRALLEGLKTQTRRLAWRRRKHPLEASGFVYCDPVDLSPWQRVKPGDLLWVRETWKPHSIYARMKPRDIPHTHVFYRSDDAYAPSNTPLVPAIHMPRWASRLTLEVTAVKVEPLQAISSNDAEAEGIESFVDGGKRFWKRYKDGGWNTYVDCPVGSYASLWTELHGPGSWEANPEVVALTFTVHKQNVDDFLRQREAA